MMREHNAHIDVQKSDVDEDENNAGGGDNGNDDDAEQK